MDSIFDCPIFVLLITRHNKIMHYHEAREFMSNTFFATLRDTFLSVFPDVFVKSKTLDEQVYKNATPHPYKQYMYFSNKLMELPETPTVYERNYENGGSYEFVKKMHDDFFEIERCRTYVMVDSICSITQLKLTILCK